MININMPVIMVIFTSKGNYNCPIFLKILNSKHPLTFNTEVQFKTQTPCSEAIYHAHLNTITK